MTKNLNVCLDLEEKTNYATFLKNRENYWPIPLQKIYVMSCNFRFQIM